MNQVQKNAKVSAKDIVEHWKVSEKTAKRDITDLKGKRVIAFSGAAKNGYYYLLKGSGSDPDKFCRYPLIITVPVSTSEVQACPIFLTQENLKMLFLPPKSGF